MKSEQLLKRYEGAFEAWKARLAVSRIKALGFPKRDWADLMQDLAVAILEFRYDPDHDNGASERTVLYAAINRHLLYRLRRRYSQRDGFRRYLRGLGVHDDGSFVGPEPCCEVDYAGSSDFQDALDSLSPFDRTVARGLAAGLSKSALARKLGCHWNTVQKAVRRIRRRFESLGLGSEDRR